MARLDVYPMPGPARPGYLVDVQSNLFSHLRTRLVVPLLPAQGSASSTRDLNPVFDVRDVPHVLLPQAMASVPTRTLRDCVGSLLDQHDVVLRALDMILVGC